MYMFNDNNILIGGCNAVSNNTGDISIEFGN